MSVIKRGIIQSYDPAAHKAAVQIAGSLAVFLDGVRVATNVPAENVVAGRHCAVLFLDASNQDDAVIVSVQGALPAQYALLAGRSGGQDVRGGTGSGENLTLESSAHATKGEVQVVDGSPVGMRNKYKNYIGQGGPDASIMLRVRNQIAGESVSINKTGICIDPFWAPSNNNSTFMGLGGLAIVNGTGRTGINAYGLNFIAAAYGGTWMNLIGAFVTSQKALSASTIIQNMECVTALPSIGPNAVIQNLIAFRSRNAGNSGAAFSIGLKIDDISAGTYKRLIEAGPTTPNLRVEAQTPSTPGSGELSNVLIAFTNSGGGVTLRRLHTKPGNTLGAGDNAVVAV